MERKATVTEIMLMVLILISFVIAGESFYLYNKECGRNQQLAFRLEEAAMKQKITEVKLKNSEKLISDTKAKLQEAQAQIDGLKSDLLRETAARQEISSKVEQASKDLEAQKKAKANLEKKTH